MARRRLLQVPREVALAAVSATRGRTDLELLVAELDTNFARDAQGRILEERVPNPRMGPFLVIATSVDARTMAPNAALSVATRSVLGEIFASEPVPRDPASAPAHAESYEEVIASEVGEVVAGLVPCFIVDAVPKVGRRLDDGAEVVVSTDARAEAIRRKLPQDHVDERRGPWAAVAVQGRDESEEVASVCSTARCSDEGAEAGTWTEPHYRGRGYASVATAAWASVMLPTERALFYCTDEWNMSSRGVAARLGLRSIGWMWKVVPGSEAASWRAAREALTSGRSTRNGSRYPAPPHPR
jgi:RimJ/RimL family protein N-acetyltransferase